MINPELTSPKLTRLTISSSAHHAMSQYSLKLIIICTALFLVAACTSKAPKHVPAPREPYVQPKPTLEPLSVYGNHSPYRVMGQTYHVLPTSAGYTEEGMASWYGPNFHGKPTSNRETFDMHDYTAAHKTLPLPSYARVTHLGNGRSVVVRINDRGPFKPGRIIDLSFAAATQLDMVNEGTAKVRVEVLKPVGVPDDRPPVVSAQFVYLQLGAFSDRANALNLLQGLRDHKLPAGQVVTADNQQGTIHRVRIGPIAEVDEAEALAARLEALGLGTPRLIFE